MCISNKFPDAAAAGAGPHSENHCPRGVNETSARSHVLQLKCHSPAASAGERSVLPATSKKQTTPPPPAATIKTASTKDIHKLP